MSNLHVVPPSANGQAHDDVEPPTATLPLPPPWTIDRDYVTEEEIPGVLARCLETAYPNCFWVMGRQLIELDPESGHINDASPARVTALLRVKCHFLNPATSRTKRRTTQRIDFENGRNLCELAERFFRPLAGVREAPYLTTDGAGDAAKGRIITTPGYNEDTKLWLHWSGRDLPHPVRDYETVREVVDALASFTFRSEVDLLHFFAFLIQPLVQPAYAGKPSPEWFVVSVVKNAGKSYLVQCASTAVTGATAPSIAATKNPGEADFQLHGALRDATRDGRTYIYFDNAESGSMIGGAERNRLITAPGTVFVRPVKSPGVYVTPSAFTWVVTANQPERDEEHFRRSVVIELMARRPVYANPNLLPWLLEHRHEVLGVLLGMIQAWIDAGHPTPPGTPMSSFEQWSNVVGGIVCHAFPHLANHWLDRRGRSSVSGIDQDWVRLFDNWPKDATGQFPAELRPRDVLTRITDSDYIALGELVLHGASQSNTQSQITKLGRELMKLARSEREIGHRYRLHSRAYQYSTLYWPTVLEVADTPLDES